MNNQSNIQLLRHATVILSMAGKKLLIDPMLGEKEAYDAVPNVSNTIRVPMVDLPLSEKELNNLLKEIDAIFVTHTHPDHWDPKAQEILPKNIPLFCQAPDENAIKAQGFTKVMVINDQVDWEGITIHRFGGIHGTGKVAELMGPVSGFVFVHQDDSVYIAGDTIWHEEVVRALDTLQPKMTVLNTGGAQFIQGDPITMTPKDVEKVHQQMPTTKIVAIHMDSINHCFIKRPDLQKALEAKQIPVVIPADGEVVEV